MTLRLETWFSGAPTRARRFARGIARAAVVAVLAALAGLATAAPALAVSMRDLVELSQAGLSDDVLIALIEADGTVFNLDGPRIIELRASGLSERVIMAMIRTARPPAAPEPAAPVAPATAAPAPEPVAAPYFVVIGQEPPLPAPAATPTYVVPWIPWTNGPRHVGPAKPFMERRGFGRFINDGWVEPARRAQP